MSVKGYYPQALELVGEQLHSPLALDFLRRWPSLPDLKAARPAAIKGFYQRHNVRRPQALTQRLELIARAVALTTDEAIVFVSRRQVERLIEELRVVQKHIERYEAEIAEAFARHPEASLFRELPGAGKVLAPRLLVAFGTDRTRFASASQLQCYSGVAPVKEKSGGQVWIHWRWNAPWFIRQTLIEWAGQSILYCPCRRRPTTTSKRKRANAIGPPSGLWPSNGSASFGSVGSPAPPMMKNTISKRWPNASHPFTRRNRHHKNLIFPLIGSPQVLGTF